MVSYAQIDKAVTQEKKWDFKRGSVSMLRDLKCILGKWYIGPGIRETWVQILTIPLINYETLGKSLKFSTSVTLEE